MGYWFFLFISSLLVGLMSFPLISCGEGEFINLSNGEVKILNTVYQDIAAEYSIDIIDTYAIMFDENGEVDASLYLTDGLHLASAGYEKWITVGLLPYIENNRCSSVIMLGNSITYGVSNHVEPSGTFSTWQSALGVTAHNFGIGGNTSYDVLKRLDHVAATEGEYVFLLIGVNDLLRGFEIWEIGNNVREIISKLQAANKKVVLQTVMPLVNE